MKRHLMMMASLVAAVAFADEGTSVVTAAPERRLVWGRPYQMLESGDGCWANVVRDLKADGITDVLCCFTVGAYARFPSKVMAPDLEMAKRGEADLVTPMVRALHAEGIKLHAWMAIANMRNAKDDEPTKARMKAEGRMAITRDGKTDREFLCREDPRNVEMLRVAAAELIALGVDGIHLDYIRYNHWADCYCEHFKKAYEANGGKNLADWPKGVDGEKGIDPVWIQTRVQAIDHIVQVLRAEVKKHPGVEFSAAVFDPPATTAVLLGQDWPRWAKEDWFDFLCPMDYMADPEDFRREILEEMPIAAAAKKTKIYPGLAVGWSGGENNARTLKEELRMARAYLPGGFTIFYWGRNTKGRIDSMLRTEETRPTVVLDLPPSASNPRNSEGDFIRLKDGRILFIYSHYTKGTGQDNDPAVLASRVSDDGGRTWSQSSEEVVANESGLNVMSVTLLRRQDDSIALFYLVKNSTSDCRPVMRVSTDEGRTWGPATQCIGDADKAYYVMNNCRVLRCKSGRLVLPLARHMWTNEAFDSAGELVCYLSDDDGKTWRRGKTAPFKTFDAENKRVTTQEPGLIELTDGRVLMYARTTHGRQWFYYSSDGCETWMKGEPGSLFGPCAPATIKRLRNGDLLAIWNDHEFLSEETKRDPMRSHGGRTPMTMAISKDEGRTWPIRRNLWDDYKKGFYCYYAVLELDDRLLVGHCSTDWLNREQITSVPLAWLYGR